MKKLYALVTLALMLLLPPLAFSNDETTEEKTEAAPVEQTADTTEQTAGDTDETAEDAKTKLKLKHAAKDSESGEMSAVKDDAAAATAETSSTSEESEEDEEEDEEPDCE